MGTGGFFLVGFLCVRDLFSLRCRGVFFFAYFSFCGITPPSGATLVAVLLLLVLLLLLLGFLTKN